MGSVTATINGITPALLGAGIGFDVDTVMTVDGRYNAARTAPEVAGYVSPIYEYSASIEGVSGVLAGLQSVRLTLDGFTPASIGGGVSFEVLSTDIGSARFNDPVPDPMSADIHLLTEASVYETEEDRSNDQDSLGSVRKRFSDLPGEYLIPGILGFEMEDVTPNEMPVIFDIILVPIPADNPIQIEAQNGSGVSGEIVVDTAKLLTNESGFIQASWYSFAETVRQRVRDALMYRLAEIKESNGYWTTVGDIVPSLARRTDIKRWPGIVLVKDNEYVTNVNEDEEDLSDDALHKIFHIVLFCYYPPEHVEIEDADDWNDRMVADIEALLGNHWQLVGADGKETCRLSLAIGSEPFTKLLGQNFTGVMIRIRVRYSQDIHDPSVIV